jgi:hypothetical protein
MQEKTMQRVAGSDPQRFSSMESAFDAPAASASARSMKAPSNIFATEPAAEVAASSLAPGGLPMQLKLGIEQLAGVSMEGVEVRYGSDVPAMYQALAFAEGDVIHLSAGQEKLLPHEAWHVAQQRLGKVKANTRMAGKPVNTDPALEEEADVMGAKAMQVAISPTSDAAPAAPVQGEGVVQGFFGFEGPMLEFIRYAIGLLGFAAVMLLINICRKQGATNKQTQKLIEEEIARKGSNVNKDTQGGSNDNDLSKLKDEIKENTGGETGSNLSASTQQDVNLNSTTTSPT